MYVTLLHSTLLCRMYYRRQPKLCGLKWIEAMSSRGLLGMLISIAAVVVNSNKKNANMRIYAFFVLYF